MICDLCGRKGCTRSTPASLCVFQVCIVCQSLPAATLRDRLEGIAKEIEEGNRPETNEVLRRMVEAGKNSTGS